MLAASETITETIKQVVQSLQIRFLFPAIVVVLANIFLLSDLGVNPKLESSYLITFFIIFIILISYLLAAFTGLIIRLAEGYLPDANWIYVFQKSRIQKKLNKLNEKIQQHEQFMHEVGRLYNLLDQDESLTEAERATIESRIQEIEQAVQFEINVLYANKGRSFHSKKLFPTEIGNTIAAFEEYPKTRYGMDAVNLWPRMLPILKENKFLEFVQHEKMTMDFLLNLGLVGFIVAVEVLLLSHSLFGSIVIFAFTSIFYFAANFVAADWGIMVCTAFDLYREELRKALYLPKISDGNLQQEQEQWERISQFIVFAETENFDGFNYDNQTEHCREGA